jgi:hypothetical protein
MVFSMGSDPKLYSESLFVAREIRELELREMGRVLEGRHFKAIEQEMARRLHSHLK